MKSKFGHHHKYGHKHKYGCKKTRVIEIRNFPSCEITNRSGINC